MRFTCAAVIALSATALGDSLYLTNGAVLEGKIVAEREREVILRLASGGILTIQRAMIKEIRRPSMTAGKGQAGSKAPAPAPAETPGPPPPPPVTPHGGPGWRIEVPSTFVLWQEANAPPVACRFREATTGAAICVVGPEEPVIEGMRPRPVWAPASMTDRAKGKLHSKKKIEIDGRTREVVEVDVDLAGKKFREVWASTGDGSARIVCACPAEHFDLYRPAFERCLQSVRTEAAPQGPASAPVK